MSSQREEAYQKVRDAITSGALRPGERLVEKKMCEMFKLGRTPLREALRQLEAEGYVDGVLNKGAIVRKTSIKDVSDIYDIVALLEGYAAEKATKHIGPEDKKKLRKIQNDCKEAARTKNYRKWLASNALFHQYFPEVSGNNYVSDMIEALRRRNYRYRLIAATIPGRMENHVSAHEEVLKAISKGDARKAGNTMWRHVAYVKKTLIDLLKQYPEL